MNETLTPVLNSRQRILAMLRSYYRLNGGRGLTSEEVQYRLGLSRNTTTAAIRTLYSRGYIDATRDRRATSSGRSAVVWIAHPDRDDFEARGLKALRVGTSVRGSHS
jgi:DNA-binding IclR family transcriptional regulator